MRVITSIVISLLVLAGAGWLTPSFAQAPETEQQKEFVPISERPAQEELPSATLVISAYSFVLLVFFAYVLMLSRKLGAVSQEMQRLEGEIKKGARR
jgi:hypothetical protein